MVKVCKLKWNMHAAKTQISMRGNRFYFGLNPPRHNIGLLKTMGCLHVNQTKRFMIASFMDLHSIHKPMSTRYP